MKKGLLILLVITMVVTASFSMAETAKEPVFTVGLSLNSLDEANNKQVNFMTAHFANEGMKLVVADAANKVDQQITDIENFVTQGVDVIAIKALDSNALVDACEAAKKAGIVIVSYLAGLNMECVDFGYNWYDFDVRQGEFLVDYLQKNQEAFLKIGYIWGTKSMEACHQEYAGVMDTLAASDVADRYQVLVEADADWAADGAITIVEDWLQAYPEMNCIVTQSDTMSCAASEALKAAGKDFSQYIILGNDGTDDAIQKIKLGEMSGSVYGSFDALTLSFTKACVGIRDGSVAMGDQVLFTDYYMITAENVDEF